MKDKYFGDINDYRKYGLIRSILSSYKFHLLVAWMLTDEDDKDDGKFTEYLSNPKKWSRHDSELYKKLQSLISPYNIRGIALIEDKNINLLPDAKYFSRTLKDSCEERDSWFKKLLSSAKDSDMVFLDPDNGLEVKSKPYGRKDSSKYLYWCEVNNLWEQGKSLLIYQHFCREKRNLFIERIRRKLQETAKGSLIAVFTTPHVVFFLLLQPEHQKHYDSIVTNVQSNWGDQIRHR